VSWLREKNDFKRRLIDALMNFSLETGIDAALEFVGARPADPLEHVTRRFVIDLLLRALGWDVHALNRQIVEEARTHGQKTLFVDYLGVTLEARIPLMIFEAKAWAKPLINASALGRDQQGSRNTASLRDLIVTGLQHCKSGAPDGESPVVIRPFNCSLLSSLHF